MTDEQAAEKWAKERASHRKAIIAYSDIADAYVVGAAHGRRAEREEILGMLWSDEAPRYVDVEPVEFIRWIESELKKKEGRKG